MAVYTHLGSEELAELVAAYNVGDLISAKGIAEGISNSNWLIETTQDRYILTMYERRIDTRDLPFFLGLLDHLSAAGCPVPRTIHDRAGLGWREVDGKAVALIEFLPGVSPNRPTPEQAQSAGHALAQIHLAALDFPRTRANDLAPADTLRILESFGTAELAKIDPRLPEVRETGRDIARHWPGDLPKSIAHTDLFPDNVLMLGNEVSGVIDFYFAAHDMMAYDLAVTHAAWTFPSGDFDAAIGKALIHGYQSLRRLDSAERSALPLLAQGACLRFIASRTQDWIDTPADALVMRKDPMDFSRRLEFYRANGHSAFA